MKRWRKNAFDTYLGKNLKYVRRKPHALIAALIIVWAVYLRVRLAQMGWPQMDSDEATMGLMALHIWHKQDFPVFFYGQGYMGALEAYLGAALFSFFGPSLFALRLGLILLFALFLFCMYLLVSALYTRNWALFVLFVLSLGSASVLTRQLVAVGGVPEMLVFAAALLTLSLWLARTYSREHILHGWRLLIYALWGVLAGLGIWSHTLILPLVCTAGLLLLLFCLRELLWGGAVALVIGLSCGLLPYILYNYHADPGQDTLSYLSYVQSANGIALPPKAVLLPLQIKGALLVALPGATGSSPLCSLADVHLIRTQNLHAIRCTLMHTGWTTALIALWLISVGLALWRLWGLVRERRITGSLRRDALICQAGRLVLLLNAAATLLLFMLSPNAALYPIADIRYLSALLMTTPALLWPLWCGLTSMRWFFLRPSDAVDDRAIALSPSRLFVSLGVLARLSLLMLVVVVLGFGARSIVQGYPPAPAVEQRVDKFATIGVYRYEGVPQTQAFNRQEASLIRSLEGINATHIYSDYWTCNRLIFRTQERIICSVLRERLMPGQNRYPLYATIVTSDPYAAYVFEEGSPLAKTFHWQLRYSKQQFKVYHFAGYIVYYPL